MYLTEKIILDRQLWKFDELDSSLKNKANFWETTDQWSIETKVNMICIRNISENKVLGITANEEEFEEGNKGQIWIQGQTDIEGYSTLQNSESFKFLIATSGKSLDTKSNYKQSNRSIKV